jgi:hypothetical protein
MLKAMAALSVRVTKCRDGQRDAVRHCKCGDGFQQHPAVLNDQKQAQQEQQVIRSQGNVADALHDERAGDRPAALRGGHFKPGLRWMDNRGGLSPVRHFHSHQNIRDGALQPHEFDALASESTFDFNHASFHERIGKFLRRRRAQILGIFWQLQHDGQAHTRINWRAPQNVVMLRGSFLDFQIGRARFVCQGTRRDSRAQRNRQE